MENWNSELKLNTKAIIEMKTQINHKFRHELKFFIGRADAELLKRKLGGFLELDPFSLNSGDGYRVTSLYFDDYQMRAYFDKLDGVEDRTKYRVRTYNFDKKIINFEAKIKKGDLSRKEILKLNYDEYEKLIKGEKIDWEKKISGLDFTNYVEILEKTKLLKPKIIVDYQRLAFLSAAGNVRITFDDFLQISQSEVDMFNYSEQGWQKVLPQEILILEVKFDQFLPIFISKMLGELSLHKIAVSKYILCQQLARQRHGILVR